MRPGDTIAAIATGAAPSPLALIRVSGPDAEHAANLLVPSLGPIAPARAIESIAHLDERRTVRAYAITYPAPRSYTAEHVIEIALPGSPWVLARAMAVLTSIDGVREAEAGEFTARAYLNGRMTLEHAEGVAATIAARTDDDLRAARSLASGNDQRAADEISDGLASLLALVEAGADFADHDDVHPIAPRDLADRLNAAIERLDTLAGGAIERDRPLTGPRVVLWGRPNAGKTTLFNALLGRTRAVASPTPGQTRDVITEPLTLDGDIRVSLSDVAGHSNVNANDALARDADHRAADAATHADIVLHCDPRGRFDDTPPSSAHAAVILVRTKHDVETAPPTHVAAIPVCAITGDGLDALRSTIADAAERAGGAALPSIQRRRRAAADARDACAHARDLALHDAGAPGLSAPELIAAELRAALHAAEPLVGRLDTEDVLGRIFATFCVGK